MDQETNPGKEEEERQRFLNFILKHLPKLNYQSQDRLHQGGHYKDLGLETLCSWGYVKFTCWDNVEKI